LRQIADRGWATSRALRIRFEAKRTFLTHTLICRNETAAISPYSPPEQQCAIPALNPLELILQIHIKPSSSKVCWIIDAHRKGNEKLGQITSSQLVRH
jgi:hypothetical protein